MAARTTKAKAEDADSKDAASTTSTTASKASQTAKKSENTDTPSADSDASQGALAAPYPANIRPADADEQAKVGKQAKKVTTVNEEDGTVTVEVVDAADTAAVARLLLDSADDPGQVIAVSSPKGWVVPTEVAKTAGIV